MANNLKQYIGAGILGLPYAFSQVGFVGALVVLVIVAVLTDHCIKMLLRCKTHLMDVEKVDIKSYGDITFFCFGKVGEILVNLLMIFSLVGVGTVYLIFIGINLNDFFPGIAREYWVLITCIPLIMISFFPSVKYFAPLSALATFAVVGGVTLFMGYSVKDVFEEKQLVKFHWEDLPYFFAIAIFAFEGILLTIPLESSMKEPSKFIIVENVSYVILTTLFSVFGLVGYLAYGASTEEVITKNLPTDSFLPSLITGFLCFSLFVSHALFSRPLFELFEGVLTIPESYSHKTTTILTITRKVMVRIVCILATAIIAIVVPSFGSVLGVIGSLSGCNYALILPAAFHIQIFFPTMSISTYVKDMTLIGVGAIIGILGFLSSVGVLGSAASH